MRTFQKPTLIIIFLALAFTRLCHSAETAAPQKPGFGGSKWIWHQPPANVTLDSFQGETVYFRTSITLPRTSIKSAEIIITADNIATLYVNGKLSSRSENWSQPKRVNIASRLKKGSNIIAVQASNTAMGPAGMMAKITVQLSDGKTIELVTDEQWKCSNKEDEKWMEPGFKDSKWPVAFVVGNPGMAPWGEITQFPATAEDPRSDMSASADATFKWPDGGIVFIGNDCTPYRETYRGAGSGSLGVTVFTARKSRSYPEYDLPSPIKIGHKLYVLKSIKLGETPKMILDAEKGAIGSPCVSFDGKYIYVSMAYKDDPFFHIYRLLPDGRKLERMTDGPFHDIDPAELPDGRIVFTSTRIGTFEEYHNTPSRALFVMSSKGKDIKPITSTFIFDNEPEILADGRIIFIRSDNFFDRGKVETLLHAIHPDGTHGYTEFGLDLGPGYGGRLRAFYCGSPAPMPDGRVAFVSASGITIGRPGSSQRYQENFNVDAGDVAALPDGRLLVTIFNGNNYERIGVLDPQIRDNVVRTVFDGQGMQLHSPVFLGPRKKLPVLAEQVDKKSEDNTHATGFFFCRNARFTKNTAAGWSHVRAIRLLGGKGLTTRSSHAYIVHAGNETVELGTVPLAPDGSFSIEVPADMAIAFQAVDAEGRSELNEMSWIYVRPGEHRGCVGCHQPRQVTPHTGSVQAMALKTPPLKMLGQGRPLHFRGNNPAVTGMMELQFDRFREVAGLNRHGELSDQAAGSKAEVELLISRLKGGDENMKISSAQRLAIFRDPAAASALCSRMKDGSRELRIAAAMAVAACGNRDSVQPLLEALDDKDAPVAQAASIALENLTGHTEQFNAFAAPEERSKQAGNWREFFRTAGWNNIERELIDRLGNKDRDVVRRAAVALGHTGGDAARPALRDYVTRERDRNWKMHHGGDGAQFDSMSLSNPRTIQAATRSLGYLKDRDAIPMLADTLNRHSSDTTGNNNLFLAEACVEALGRIAAPEVESILTNAFAQLKVYTHYTSWYGDHGALMACHASPVHYFILEALDAMESKNSAGIVPHIIRSVPTDPDRALFFWNDDYETIAGRVIRRNDPQSTVIETCLKILGDPQTNSTPEIASALGSVQGAWAGTPDIQNRAAQILSLTCRDRKYVQRINAALERYRTLAETDIPRVFNGGGLPPGGRLPVKNWVCFFLARTLGNMADPSSVEPLIAVIEQCPPEAENGSPDPTGAGVLFLHNGLTPCYRAAAAWALGKIKDKRAVSTLIKAAANMKNAPDTRHAAAVALDEIGDESSFDKIEKMTKDYPDIATRRALLQAAGK